MPAVTTAMPASAAACGRSPSSSAASSVASSGISAAKVAPIAGPSATTARLKQ